MTTSNHLVRKTLRLLVAAFVDMPADTAIDGCELGIFAGAAQLAAALPPSAPRTHARLVALFRRSDAVLPQLDTGTLVTPAVWLCALFARVHGRGAAPAVREDLLNLLYAVVMGTIVAVDALPPSPALPVPVSLVPAPPAPALVPSAPALVPSAPVCVPPAPVPALAPPVRALVPPEPVRAPVPPPPPPPVIPVAVHKVPVQSKQTSTATVSTAKPSTHSPAPITLLNHIHVAASGRVALRDDDVRSVVHGLSTLDERRHFVLVAELQAVTTGANVSATCFFGTIASLGAEREYCARSAVQGILDRINTVSLNVARTLVSMVSVDDARRVYDKLGPAAVPPALPMVAPPEPSPESLCREKRARDDEDDDHDYIFEEDSDDDNVLAAKRDRANKAPRLGKAPVAAHQQQQERTVVQLVPGQLVQLRANDQRSHVRVMNRLRTAPVVGSAATAPAASEPPAPSYVFLHEVRQLVEQWLPSRPHFHKFVHRKVVSDRVYCARDEANRLSTTVPISSRLEVPLVTRKDAAVIYEHFMRPTHTMTTAANGTAIA